jgi:hypothetical protein
MVKLQLHADLRLAWKLLEDAGHKDAANRVFMLLESQIDDVLKAEISRLEADLVGQRFAATQHLHTVTELTRINTQLVDALRLVQKRADGQALLAVVEDALRSAGAL